MSLQRLGPSLVMWHEQRLTFHFKHRQCSWPGQIKVGSVEQQGGLADNELSRRGTAGIQISWEVIGNLSCGRADNTRKAHEEMQLCYPTFSWSGWCLRSCSAAAAWPGTGEKKPLIFVVRKHREILFFQRGKLCLNWKKRPSFFVCVSQLFFYSCILKGSIKYKQVFCFVLLFVNYWEKIGWEMLGALSVQCPPVWKCPALRKYPKFCYFCCQGTP